MRQQELFYAVGGLGSVYVPAAAALNSSGWQPG